MKSHPILFSAPMVRAILDGSKTQTRRVCKSQPYANGFKWDGNDFLCHNDYLPPSAMLMDGGGKSLYTTSDHEGWESECPYGLQGDQLWVRETFARDDEDGMLVYRADIGLGGDADDWERNRLDGANGYRWRPSIHMPRAVSRITLEITGVRVERLQDISIPDCYAEGAITESWTEWRDDVTAIAMPEDSHIENERDVYRRLWEGINGPESWTANPFVWVIEFRRTQP